MRSQTEQRKLAGNKSEYGPKACDICGKTIYYERDETWIDVNFFVCQICEECYNTLPQTGTFGDLDANQP